MKLEKLKNRLFICLLGIILAGVYWQWWTNGPRVAQDFSLVSAELIKSYFNFPHTWSAGGTEGLGEYTVFTLWSWPFNFLYGALAQLGLSVTLIQRILIIIPFLIFGSLGICKLGKSLGLSVYAAGISVLFYLLNTYILLVIDGGQLTISLSYALFPLGFYVLEKAVGGSLKQKILMGLLISGMGVFDIRFLYIFFLLGFLRFLYEFFFLNESKWVSWIKQWSITGLISFLIVAGLNAYWIITLIKFPLTANFYAYLTQTSFDSLISLGNALLLLSPHWYQNVFGKISPLRLEFILIPLLVFAAPLLVKKNKLIGFWLLVSIISIFLTKGSAEPLSGIYPWFYNNLPGFSLFRDSSKFFFLTALSYSLLLGVTTDAILTKVGSFKARLGIALTLIVYLLFLVRPVWLGQMTGTFSKPSFEKEYETLNKIIESDKTASNVVWIPTIAPLTVLNSNHPAIDATRLAQKRPFVQANVGTYELFNFLREASFMGELFSVSNTGYIAYPLLDTKRANLHPDNIKYYYTFLDQLSKLPWLYKVEGSPVSLFKVKIFQDKLFLAPNAWIVLGSDDIYRQATTSAELSLSKNALVFLEEKAGQTSLIDKVPAAKIILQSKQQLDLAASLIPEDRLIFPAQQLQTDPNLTGWWKRETGSWLSFKDFLRSKYKVNLSDFDLGGGWAVGEGNLSLPITSNKIKKGQQLLARVMESSQSGSLKFYQDKRLLGEVKTENKEAGIRWFEVGTLVDDNKITITATGNINLVNALAVAPADYLSELKNKVAFYQSRIAEYKKEEIEKREAALSYQQISPTKYIVTVEDLLRPQVLVFAQNYDNRWELNGQKSFPVYSFLNGFYIEKNGQYNLEFKPQDYIPVGLLISAITLLVVLALLLV